MAEIEKYVLVLLNVISLPWVKCMHVNGNMPSLG